MTEARKLTQGRLLARNTVLNLIGQVAPMFVAAVTIPILIHNLGTERFGVLTLVWMVIGYFSLFDLGLSRALTQVVSEKLGRGEDREVPSLVWTGLLCMLVMGVVGGLGLAGFASGLVRRVLNVPPFLIDETIVGTFLLALSLPVVITTAGLRGVLEAKQRFDLVNAVRVPMGIFTFLGPLAVLPFTRSIVAIVIVSVVFRLVVWAVHLWMCFHAMPTLRARPDVDLALLRPLLRYGGWMTVSNLVSPVMVYLDRFLIGSVLSLAAVAYYVTPYEVITKVWIVPAALVAVLFPAFATSFAFDRGAAARLFERGNKTIFVALFPIVLTVVAFAPEGLHLWLGAEYAANSTPVLRWLAVGVFINSLAHLPFSVVQGAGRSDLTAKLHFVELPLYLAALYLLTVHLGVVGAAIAWAGRAVFDTTVLLVMTERFLPSGGALLLREVGRAVAATLVLALVSLPLELGIRVGLTGAILSIFVWLAWAQMLAPEERELVLARLRPLRVPAAPRS